MEERSLCMREVQGSIPCISNSLLYSINESSKMARPYIALNLPVKCSRNRLVVRTPRCGRGNPGSNPGYGTDTD